MAGRGLQIGHRSLSTRCSPSHFYQPTAYGSGLQTWTKCTQTCKVPTSTQPRTHAPQWPHSCPAAPQPPLPTPPFLALNSHPRPTTPAKHPAPPHPHFYQPTACGSGLQTWTKFPRQPRADPQRPHPLPAASPAAPPHPPFLSLHRPRRCHASVAKAPLAPSGARAAALHPPLSSPSIEAAGRPLG